MKSAGVEEGAMEIVEHITGQQDVRDGGCPLILHPDEDGEGQLPPRLHPDPHPHLFGHIMADVTEILPIKPEILIV